MVDPHFTLVRLLYDYYFQVLNVSSCSIETQEKQLTFFKENATCLSQIPSALMVKSLAEKAASKLV